MITLVKGKENIITLKVNAVEDLTGFSASLFACGVEKTQALENGKPSELIFSAEEVAAVSETSCGEYGTLTISDPTGEVRLKVQPQFRLMEFKDSQTVVPDQTIYVSLPYAIKAVEEGGGSIDPSKYATKSDVTEAEQASKRYTDEQISGIGDVIITGQEITVVDGDGHEKQMTVQQAAQNVVDMQSTLDKAMAHSVSWEVKDEDEDGQPDEETLYFHKSTE